MRDKNAATIETANDSAQETVVKEKSEKKELHDLFWTIGIILGLVSIVFVLIAKNAINNGGVWTIPKYFAMKRPLEISFMTAKLASLIAGILAVASVGCGVTRNVLKRQNWLLGYLVGLVALILSAIAWFAAQYLK